MSTVFSVDDNEGKQILKPSYEKSGKKRNTTKNDYLSCGLSICILLIPFTYTHHCKINIFTVPSSIKKKNTIT